MNSLGEKEFFSEETLPVLIREVALTAKPYPIASRQVAFAIPEEKVFIKGIQLPKKEGATVSDMIEEKIDAILPYSRDEVYIDWQVVPDKKVLGDSMAVLVAASPKIVVDSYISVIRQAGFEPAIIETEPNALLWGVTNPFKINKTLDTTLILDVGMTKTTAVITKEEVIQFTSSINNESEHIIKEADKGKSWLLAEKGIQVLAAKIKEYIDYYEAHSSPSQGIGGDTIKRIILCGAWADFPELTDTLKEMFHIPVKGPDRIVSLHPAYTTALGLSLRGLYQEEYADF